MAESSTIPIQDNQQLLVKICHPLTWRIANVFMAVFFSLAAYVQVSVWFVYKYEMRILSRLRHLIRLIKLSLSLVISLHLLVGNN